MTSLQGCDGKLRASAPSPHFSRPHYPSSSMPPPRGPCALLPPWLMGRTATGHQHLFHHEIRRLNTAHPTERSRGSYLMNAVLEESHQLLIAGQTVQCELGTHGVSGVSCHFPQGHTSSSQALWPWFQLLHTTLGPSLS